VAPSRSQSNVLWIHEDSGATPAIYAVTPEGKLLGRWDVETDFWIYDWEDISIEPIDGGPDLIWVGDIGDNAARDPESPGEPRTSIRIARIPEPVIDPALAPISSSVEAIDSFEFTYPDKPHDAEALAADPLTGDLYLFAKEEASPSSVFRARAPLASGVLEAIATIDDEWLDGADFSPNGRELLVRNYFAASYWERPEGKIWDDVLEEAAINVRLESEPAGESIGFAGDASGFYTISEGTSVPIWFYEKTCSASDFLAKQQ
jgi:hypothetical protein